MLNCKSGQMPTGDEQTKMQELGAKIERQILFLKLIWCSTIIVSLYSRP